MSKPKKLILEDSDGRIEAEITRKWIRLYRVSKNGKVTNIIGFEPHILRQIKTIVRQRITLPR